MSCGVVVVRDTPDGIRFLLLRAFRHWDFPKGMNEAGENPLDTAAREVEEETALVELAFDWGSGYTETGPYNRRKVARYYLARTNESRVELPVNPELGRPEHSDYRWVDYDEALALTSPRVRPVLEWAANVLRLRVPRGKPEAGSQATQTTFNKQKNTNKKKN